MYIKFISLKFNNILSYGQKMISFNFESGLNALIGKNGNGKSTILDALSFCLYGVPYRKIKIKELLNRTNKNKLFTECEFIANNDHYKIIRTLSPDNINIFKNNNELELLSAKKLTQDDINKIIGIDHILFKQIICLAVNYNKPFLSLGIPDKRKITESIFNVKIFSSMLKICKREQSDYKIQTEINDRALLLMDSNNKHLKTQIINVKYTINNFDQENKKEIETIRTKITKCKEQIVICKERIEISNNALSLLTTDDQLMKTLNAELNKNNSLVDVEKYKIKEINKKIKLLLNEKKCPACDHDITEEYCNSKIIELEIQLKQITKHITDLEKEIVTINSKIDKENNNIGEINKIENVRDRVVDKLKMHKIDHKRYVNEIKKIKQRKLDFDLESLHKEYSDKRKEYDILYYKNKDLKRIIELNKIIIGVLSEGGIKAHFFKKLIPILNIKINEYIQKFELPIMIMFDELMEATITNISGKNVLSYMSFSEGEKKRIDISILLSFVETMKSISNWRCNIIVMDEILDSGVDDDGLEKIIETIKELIDDHDLCAYLISHKLGIINEELINNKIEIIKVGGFSKIVTRKGDEISK